MENHVQHPSSNDVVVNVNGDSDSEARRLHPTDHAFSSQQQQQRQACQYWDPASQALLSAMDGLRAPFPSVSKCKFWSSNGFTVTCASGSTLCSSSHCSVSVAKEFTASYTTILAYLRLYLPTIYSTSFGEMENLDGFYLVVLYFALQIAFLFTIYPSLVLTYAGQTAYLIKHPNDHDDGFYKFIPTSVYWPIFVIATSAAVVASQSLISATFSVIKQSVVLDYFPRVKVVHTSKSKEGEVYSPEVNYILMVLCVAVILIFGDGKDIGNAFGVVVSLVMLITTILLTLVMIMIWRTPAVLVCLYFVVFFVMEGIYVSAVFTKFAEGGWIPFAISFILAFIMFGWFYGRQKKTDYELTHKITFERLEELLADRSVNRVPGLCFFYTNIQDGLTPILGHYIKNMKSLHKVTVFTTLKYLLVPKVAPQDRIVIKKSNLKGVYCCMIQYGYADALNLEGDHFVDQVISSLEKHIQKHQSPENLSDSEETEEETSNLEEARVAGVVHVRGKTRFYIGQNCSWFDKFVLSFYEVMHNNCRSGLPALGIPPQQRIEVGMLYEA
ncbi:potassium transporter [Vigna angularis]|uniref:Potassium transporter n=1 Tax=Phaseolus angularis TaxID=3914 RepID=A0A8T0LG85_PHAAN|nr:potassium transporter [Vigna angularis]